MSTNIRVPGFIALCLSLLFSACNNGGSGPGNPAAAVYTGSTVQATVSEENAAALALGGFDGSMIGATVGNVSLAPGYGGTAQPGSLPVRQLAQIVNNSIRRMEVSRTAHREMTAKRSSGSATAFRGVESFQINGDNGGNASYTLNVDDSTGDFTGTIAYNNYSAGGIVLAGNANISGTFDANYQDLTRATISFSSLSVSGSGLSITLVGSLSWSFDRNAPSETMTIDMVLVDKSDARTYWFSNYVVDTRYNTNSLTQTVSGKYYDPDYGYVDISTEQAVAAFYGSMWPWQGTLKFSGKLGTWARLSFHDVNLLIEADTDGSGTIDWQAEQPTNTRGDTNLPPVADAGFDRTVDVDPTGSLVILDGSGSYDPNGDLLGYSWALESKPAGSGATLADADREYAALTVDIPGTYVVALAVTDGAVTSRIDRVTITAVHYNDSPLANAGADQTVDVGVIVTLDCSGSSDPERDPMTYSWTFYGPFGSTATLSNPTACNPTFKADLPGTYTASLAVNDGTVTGSADQVKITANYAVVADAGSDQYLPTGPGSAVTLDGTGSYAVRGGAVAYSWSFKSKPAGSAAVFSDPSTARPVFIADVEGKYVVSLVANSGPAASAPDTVTIIVITERPIDWLNDPVVDAAYSRQLDRIITVSGNNQLHVHDPAGGGDSAVSLGAPAASLSISSDGMFAAVGHNGFISYVDLTVPAVVTTFTVSGNLTDAALAANGYIYAFSDEDHAPMQSVKIDTGSVATVGTWFFSGGAKAVAKPDGTALFVAPAKTDIYKFNIPNGTVSLSLVFSIPGRINYTGCGKIWLSEDGLRMFSQCEFIYHESTGNTGFPYYLETLGTIRKLVHVSQSTAAGKVAAIPDSSWSAYTFTDDSEIHVFDSANLAEVNIIPIQRTLSGGSYVAQHARYVFFNSDGTKMYAVVQQDIASGSSAFGIVTY